MRVSHYLAGAAYALAGLTASLGLCSEALGVTTSDCNRGVTCAQVINDPQNPGQVRCVGPYFDAGCSSTNCHPCGTHPCTVPDGSPGSGCACTPDGAAPIVDPCMTCSQFGATGGVMFATCVPTSCLPDDCEWEIYGSIGGPGVAFCVCY